MITGASSGIGRALALLFASHGWRLILAARSERALHEVAEQATQHGSPEARPVVTDLAQPQHAADTLASAVEGAISVGGGLDLLIHSAALFARAAFVDAPVETFVEMLTVNVVAPFALTQRLVRPLAAAPGQVVYINSSAGTRAAAQMSQYSSSKHALRGLADSLRVELGELRIRVLSVFCGRVATPMQQQNCAAEGRVYRPEEFLTPNEVALAVYNAVSLPVTTDLTELHLRPANRTY